MNEKIGFIGMGQMGEAILSGITDKRNVVFHDADRHRAQFVFEKYHATSALYLSEVVLRSDIVILAVKPQILPHIAADLRAVNVHDKVIVSILAGLSTDKIGELIGPAYRIVRVMPNIAARVRSSTNAIYFPDTVPQEYRDPIIALFAGIGTNVIVEHENLFDAITAVSGSGPAYVAYFVEALIDAGIKLGLPRTQARQLAVSTFEGTVKILIESGIHTRELMDSVSSPGGTTIAAVKQLEQDGVKGLIMDAVEKAFLRSRELREG